MMVTGMSYDTAEDMIDPLPAADKKMLKEVWSIWLKDATPGQTYPTGESLVQACAWTSNNGRLRERWQGYHSYEFVADAQRPFERLEQERVFNSDPDVRLHKSTLFERSYLFRSNKGYFSFGPINAMPGDKVCVLLGCSVLVFLCKQPSGTSLSVSCTYVHGLINGETLLGPLHKDGKFVLRTDHTGGPAQEFVDSRTQTRLKADPRLEPLPAEWNQS
jgi:hypothetical protein